MQTSPAPPATVPVREAEWSVAAGEEGPMFGAREPTRFAADVEYGGRSGDHDYVVRVRHRLLDTAATVLIDGVEHDPKAEERAAKAAGTPAPPADGLRFRCDDGFSSLRIRVRRPDSAGELADAERIVVRTAGLGGAGEVLVERSFGRVPLVPADGSPSAAREERRIRHPARYALSTALMSSARYLLPLLGLGALVSGLLDPVVERAEARMRPALDSVAAFLAPLRDRLSGLLRPVVDAVRGLRELLFGWIPDLSMPFSIPEWVVDVAIPLVVVLAVFAATFRELRQRGRRLAASRAETEGEGDVPGADGEGGVDR